MAGIDLTAAAQAFTSFYNQLNQVAIQTVGMVVHWMRVSPHEKSEDVIFHEYTLHNVECPKEIKIVTSNTSYNPGNFSVDYFGINYEAPFEVSVDKGTWESVYGDKIMPQQHDIVYVDILNCLYEVASSTIEYGFSNQETGYKMQLVKWNPRANVKLNKGVADTISDLTVGESVLFNDEISKQIADIVDEPETSQMINTSEPKNDTFKSVDLDSVIMEEITTKDNIVAKSYYDLRHLKQTIIYKNGDVVDLSEKDNQRYFSCWFKIVSETQTTKIDKLILEDGKYYLNSNVKGLLDGGEIEIDRGSILHMHAVTNRVVNPNGQERYMITFNNSEFRDMTKKVTNWNNNLTLTKSNVHPLLMGRTNGKNIFNISLIGNSTLLVKFGNKTKRIAIDKFSENIWCAIAINIGKNSNAYLVTKDSDWNLKLQHEIKIGDLSNNFNVGEFYIPQSETMLTHIRLYQVDENVSSDKIMKDLNWVLTKNDSKTIINDNASIPNTSPYITTQR